jgi:hypothetical protein
LDFALESIAAGVAEVFGFRFVTIVIAEDDSDVMVRRVMHGSAPETIIERKNEEVSRTGMLALLDKRFESAENCFYWNLRSCTRATPPTAPAPSCSVVRARPDQPRRRKDPVMRTRSAGTATASIADSVRYVKRPPPSA